MSEELDAWCHICGWVRVADLYEHVVAPEHLRRLERRERRRAKAPSTDDPVCGKGQ